MRRRSALIICLAILGTHVIGLTYFASSIELLVAYAHELNYKLEELESDLERLDQHVICDCESDEQQQGLMGCCSTIQKLKDEMVMLNEQVELMRVGPPSVLKVKLSSNDDVIVFEHNNAYYASLPKCKTPDFPLEEGDHNLWYGDNDDLWGYDKNGRLFVVIKDKRKLLTASNYNFNISRR